VAEQWAGDPARDLDLEHGITPQCPEASSFVGIGLCARAQCERDGQSNDQHSGWLASLMGSIVVS
jgi:hypothetical protein